MYDMPRLSLSFSNVCTKCKSILVEYKSDLTEIAVQYHRNYHIYSNYKHFIKSNPQLDDNKFGRSNLIFRDGAPIRVGDRREEIEAILSK